MFLYKSATAQQKSSEPISVTKHGSHNQSSHGRRGSGGSGAIGTASNSALSPELNTGAEEKTRRAEMMFGTNSKQHKAGKIAEAREDIDNRMIGLKDAAERHGEKTYPKTIVQGTMDAYKQTKAALGNKSKVRALRTKAVEAGIRAQSPSVTGTNYDFQFSLTTLQLLSTYANLEN